jgi:lysophospholipase L1-like esterase
VRKATSKVLRKLAALAVAAAATLLLAELACRALLPSARFWFPVGAYEADEDPRVGYHLTPGFRGVVENNAMRYRLRVNALACRGPELERAPGEKLLLVLGDSFGFGQGVEEEDAFPSVLARGLAPAGWKVLNAATYGYAPEQERLIYERLHAKLAPEAVLVQLCPNDVVDPTAPVERGVYRGVLLARLPHGPWEEAKTLGVRYSELLAQVRFTAWERLHARPRLHEFLCADFEERRAHEIAATRAVLERWADACRSRGQRFVVTCVPDRTQVEPSWAETIAQWERQGQDVDLDAAQRWLLELASAREDVIYVDAVAPLREAARAAGAPLYLERDEHLTAAGHHVVGSRLLASMRP